MPSLTHNLSGCSVAHSDDVQSLLRLRKTLSVNREIFYFITINSTNFFNCGFIHLYYISKVIPTICCKILLFCAKWYIQNGVRIIGVLKNCPSVISGRPRIQQSCANNNLQIISIYSYYRIFHLLHM